VDNDVVMSISQAWLAGLFVVAVASIALLARIVGKPRRAATVNVGEEGVSYSLAFVLTLPFIMLFCSIVIECVVISATKLGVSYAAYAGARSAIVWSSAKPAKLRSERIEQSVLSALAPFTFDRWDAPYSPALLLKATEYRLAYSRLISNADAARTIDAASASRRYRYAGSKTSLKVTDKNGVTTVEVSYRYRCFLGVVGRMLDPDHTSPFEITIKSEVELPSETPPLGDLGIDYHTE
jgi:hypothetical protein